MNCTDKKDNEKMNIKRYICNAKDHLSVINRHRREVRKNCFRCGLYKQGLLHDLSKYSWTEFSVGIKYFQGDRSPNDAEREDKGYTSAWLHHKGRNKHHLEYWIDYDVKQGKGGIAGMRMPDNYIVEMFCDRVAASKIYKGDDYTDSSALEYYDRGRGRYVLHPYVRKKLEMLLEMLAEKGEDYTFRYARKWMEAYRARQYRLKHPCCCKCQCGGCCGHDKSDRCDCEHDNTGYDDAEMITLGLLRPDAVTTDEITED